MGYMQIAAKNAAKKQMAKKPVAKAKVLPSKNMIEKPVVPKGSRALPSSKKPVPGTPFAALSDLMTKK